MAIKNFKSYIKDKTAITKGILVATSVALGMTISAAFQPEMPNAHNSNQPAISTEFSYKDLDRNKLNTGTTTLKEREAYYQENVEDILNNMTDEEKASFYVNLNIDYQNEESYSDDNLMFLRNDNHYKGDITVGTNTVSIPPGIYKIVSRDIQENAGDMGEIELLTPGAELDVTIDYATKTATVETNSPKVK